MQSQNDTLLPTWRHDAAPALPPPPADPSADTLVPTVTAYYAQADASLRARLLQALLRPLGPLALVGIAAGAFASLLPASQRWQGVRITPEAAAAIGSDAVRELALYLVQKSPDMLPRLLAQLGVHIGRV
jgi:hypothetical protein